MAVLLIPLNVEDVVCVQYNNSNEPYGEYILIRTNIFDVNGAANPDIKQCEKQGLKVDTCGIYMFEDVQNGNRIKTAYMPIGITGWRAQCALPESYTADAHASTELWMLVLICIGLMSFFLLAIVFMRIIRRDQRTIMMQIARYRVLQEISRDSMTEYVPQTDTFTYSYVTSAGELRQAKYEHYMDGLEFREDIHPDCWDMYKQALTKAINKPMYGEIEVLLKRGNENYKWYRMAYKSIANERGEVVSVLTSAANVDELVTARESARIEAATDSMTGIYNKKALISNITERMAKKCNTMCALLMIDMDDFKMINDGYGHVEGDKALQNIARLLQRVFSVDDIIGRFGGDEFIVFMQNVSYDSVCKRIEQFRMLLAEMQESKPYAITCSIGVLYSNKSDQQPEMFLKCADDAMYHIKQNGKNGVCFWQTGM